MVGAVANIGAAGDPRVDPEHIATGAYPTKVLEKLHDPSIPIEEYLYYAKISRAEEDRLYGPGSSFAATPGPTSRFIKEKILRKEVAERQPSVPRLSISAQGGAQMENGDEKGEKTNGFQPIPITDDEWVQASRAARTATW